jgi:hypothetical protein
MWQVFLMWSVLKESIESLQKPVPGARFHSKTAALAGLAMALEMHAYHTFLQLKTDEGCHIVTEEAVRGPARSNSARNSRGLCRMDTISG